MQIILDCRTTPAVDFKTQLGFNSMIQYCQVDEQGHYDRDIDYEIERQEAIEKELGCKFIRINPAKKDCNIFVEIGKIQNYITK